MYIDKYLVPTIDRHRDMLDAHSFMIAAQEAKLRDEYVLMYVKKKPRYMPNFIYRWVLSKVLVTANFSLN